MNNTTLHDQLTEKLTNIYQRQGYVTEDVLYEEIEKTALSIDEIDLFVDHLLSIGIIIRDDIDDEIYVDSYDRSKIDYEVLFREVVKADPSLLLFINKIRSIRPPQNREWLNLIPQAKNNNKYAKDRIVEMYIKIAVKIAYSYYKKLGLPLAETIQDGCIGLVIAIEKFEIGKQNNFATYAPWWIQQNIVRRAAIKNPLVYVPVHVKEKLFNIYDILEDFCFNQYDCSKIDDELLSAITKRVFCTKEEAMEYLGYLNAFFSIEELIEVEETDISDHKHFEEKMLLNINNNELSERFVELFNDFSEREKNVIIARYGFDDGCEKTLEEIGKVIGVTRERIRQIEYKAIKKLKNPKRMAVLVDFFD